MLVTARELDQQYVWTAHEVAALKAGLEPSIIDIVKLRKSRDTTQLIKVVVHWRTHQVYQSKCAVLFEHVFETFGDHVSA